MSEILKDINGFEDYLISNMGFVISKERTVIRRMKDGRMLPKRIRAIVLKPSLSGGGYEFVTLRKDGSHYNRRIHRLVSEHFVEGKKEGLIVHHKNGCKTDNMSINLEWISKQSNTQKYYNSIGKSCGEIPIKDIPLIIERVKNGEQCVKIAKEYKVTRNDIAVLCKVVSLTGEEIKNAQ